MMMKFQLRNILIYSVIMVIITGLWKGYEILMFGETRPDAFHSFIAVLVSVSITVNIMQWEFFKKYTE